MRSSYRFIPHQAFALMLMVMRCTPVLGLLLGLGLMMTGLAQQPSPVHTTLILRQLEPALAGHPVHLQVAVANRGQAKQVIGGLGTREIPCPLVKVYDRAGGPPLIERYILADCILGEPVTFRPGEIRHYGVTLPMRLRPGEYTVVLTLRSQPPRSGRASVTVGPGPFVATPVLPYGAKAGRPLELRVAFQNVWRSAVSRDLRLCGQGLLIRDARGTVVYDSMPEGQVCPADSLPTAVAAGGVHLEPWGPLPALKAGSYTAIFWGKAAGAMQFVVRR